MDRVADCAEQKFHGVSVSALQDRWISGGFPTPRHVRWCAAELSHVGGQSLDTGSSDLGLLLPVEFDRFLVGFPLVDVCLVW